MIDEGEGVGLAVKLQKVHLLELLGEKFRSDDTIHTIIRKISSKAKLHAKLHLFHDHTIHVRGGIYRAPAFVFFKK
jgi:hypothetical protein